MTAAEGRMPVILASADDVSHHRLVDGWGLHETLGAVRLREGVLVS